MKTSVRVTPRIHCPIEPEVLLADIQGELPIDEARMVALHMRTCERCQARSAQLRAAYEQIAGLADVAEVPVADVRDAVLRESQGRLRAIRLTRGLNLSGRGWALTVTALVVALIIFIAFVARPLLQSHFLSTQRSQNGLTTVASIGHGLFYAETIKLIPVTVNGTQWDVGEIIAVDERTGKVVQSLPASSSSPFIPALGIGAGTNVRPALSADGRTLVAAAIASDGSNPTAFAVIDTLTGKVRFVHELAVPAGADAQANPVIQQIWLSADNTTIFILSDIAVNGVSSPRLLQFSLLNGAQSPNVWPALDVTNPTTTLDATSVMVIPGNKMLFSATPATNASGQAGVNIAFVSIASRQVQATLFVAGDARFFGLAATPDGSQLFLFNGHTGLLSFISTASRSITGQLSLTIPGTIPHSGTAQQNGEATSLVVAPDGKHLYITRDAPNDAPRNYELWAVDTSQQALLYTSLQSQPLGVAGLSSDGSNVVLLRDGGKLEATPAMVQAGQAATLAPWVALADGAQIIQVIGADIPPQ